MIRSLARDIRNMLPVGIRARIAYYKAHGSVPRIRHPQTFSEMIQRRKIFDRNPRLPLLADKVLVKEFVALTLGPDWIIPTLWHGPRLPPRTDRRWTTPFVIKSNNASGANFFVESDRCIQWRQIEQHLSYNLVNKYGMSSGEWLYTAIKPQIIVERFIGEIGSLPVDFKIWVFNGRAELIQIDTDRDAEHKRCFYNRGWIKQSFGLKYPVESRDIERPVSFEEMVAAAEMLSNGFDFVRVDFYEIDGRPLFGEMTFYPGSGNEVFTDIEVDYRLGKMWQGQN